jgi:hypothetical protein
MRPSPTHQNRCRTERDTNEDHTHLKLDHNVLDLLIEAANDICLLLCLDESFGEPEKLRLFVDRCNACVDRLAHFRNHSAESIFT